MDAINLNYMTSAEMLLFARQIDDRIADLKAKIKAGKGGESAKNNLTTLREQRALTWRTDRTQSKALKGSRGTASDRLKSLKIKISDRQGNRCGETTKKGHPCMRKVKDGGKCYQHQGGGSEEKGQEAKEVKAKKEASPFRKTKEEMPKKVASTKEEMPKKVASTKEEMPKKVASTKEVKAKKEKRPRKSAKKKEASPFGKTKEQLPEKEQQSEYTDKMVWQEASSIGRAMATERAPLVPIPSIRKYLKKKFKGIKDEKIDDLIAEWSIDGKIEARVLNNPRDYHDAHEGVQRGDRTYYYALFR